MDKTSSKTQRTEKVLILCPLGIELKLLKKHLPLEFTGEDSPYGQVWKTEKWALAISGHGKAQTAAQTSFWVSKFDPDFVFFCGAAGALTPNLNIGDVLIAQSTIEHDYKEKFRKEAPLPQFFGDSKSIERISKLKNHFLKIGTVASGDEDIVDSERASELHRFTSADAVAWEGAGAARACHFLKKPFLEIRVITDKADSNAAIDFRENLELGMKNLSEILSEFSQYRPLT